MERRLKATIYLGNLQGSGVGQRVTRKSKKREKKNKKKRSAIEVALVNLQYDFLCF